MLTKQIVLVLAFLALSTAANDCEDFDLIIEKVNNANTTWTAGRNFGPEVTCEHMKRLLGPLRPNMTHETDPFLKSKTNSGTPFPPIPDEFDARKKWPKCPTISHIQDQSNLPTGWASTLASQLADQLCIATDGKFTLPRSVQYLITCPFFPPGMEWDLQQRGLYMEKGIPTGGDYNSGIGCQPFELPPCQHVGINGTRPSCDTVPKRHFKCHYDCTNPKYNISFSEDLFLIKDWEVTYGDLIFAQQQLMTFGPVGAFLDVYEDFYHYKSGVYQHVAGRFQGLQAVRILGWGTENGTPYWLAANSWNTDWGDKGTFKIKRGSDECSLEEILEIFHIEV